MTDLFGFNKIVLTLEMLRQMEPEDGYYLAFSGGKDSIVLYELAQLAEVKFDAHFHVTVDPPELVKFIREKFPNVIHDRPEKTMWQIIPAHLMPPTRIVRYCCEELKERGGDGRIVLTGVRADESNKRRTWRHINPCSKRGKTLIHPILWWSEDDVWNFIKERRLSYCSLYNEGFRRIGCVGCPMAGPDTQRREFARWPKIRMAYIHAFERMLKERRGHGKGNYTWESGEEVMGWWLKEARKESNEDQPLFA